MIAHQMGPIAAGLTPNIASIVTPVALTITNPGAESSNTGWTLSSGNLLTVTTATNGAPRSGSRFFSSNTVIASGNWSQTITIPSSAYFGVDNSAYQLSFDRYMNCQTTGSGTTHMQFDFLDAIGNVLNRVFTVAKTATQNTWTLLNDKVIVPPGTRSIKIYLWMMNATVNVKVYVDDMAASLIQLANSVKADLSYSFAIFGNRLDAIGVRDAITYPIFGTRLTAVGVRDAFAYFIVKP